MQQHTRTRQGVQERPTGLAACCRALGLKTALPRLIYPAAALPVHLGRAVQPRAAASLAQPRAAAAEVRFIKRRRDRCQSFDDHTALTASCAW